MEQQINILVVEDDEDINDLICNILKRNNYNAKSAYSGSEAKLLIEYNDYDLLLLDLMLPGESGENTIKEIRKEKLGHKIEVSLDNDNFIITIKWLINNKRYT